MTRSDFGTTRKLPSGRWQARYTGPDDVRRTAGTYATKKDARTALAAVAVDIAEQGASWLAPGVDPIHDEVTKLDKVAASLGMKRAAPTFGKFAAEVLELRADQLAPRTREVYESLLTRHLLPTFGNLPLTQVTVHRVDAWWAEMGKSTGKVTRRNSYYVLSNVMKFALRYKHIQSNPCIVENAGKAVAKDRPYLSVEEFEKILSEAPAELAAPLWTLFGAHVRLGELLGLNRGDVDVKTGVIRVTKQSQVIRGGLVIRETKTGNQRELQMLQPAIDALTLHLASTDGEMEDPLFKGPKGGRLSRGYMQAQWTKARERAGLPGAHLHDIRHTGLTLVAAHGSTREVMHRGGHTAATAALKYQHATADRDSAVAAAANAALSNQSKKTDG